MLNTLNPIYRQPYGCGTVAIANVLNWKSRVSDLNQIQYLLQEKNFISFSHNLTKTLEKLNIEFTYQDETNIDFCLKALNNKQGIVLLSWGEGTIGHYSFFYRNRYGQLLENDKLSAPILFKALASKKSPKSGKRSLAWIIK